MSNQGRSALGTNVINRVRHTVDGGVLKLCYVAFPSECYLSLEKIQAFYPLRPDSSDLVGYVEKDGEPGFSNDENVYLNDSIQDGMVVFLKDGCNNW